MPDLSGRALNGRYELHAVIGEGAFGRVYRGRDRLLARSVAVKVIKPWWTDHPEWVRRFEREAQLMASVSDPGIVQIFDVGHAEEGLYYVTELVEGESVAARLRRGQLAFWEAREVAEQLCRALAPAHARRVVHRDIKPANVLISSSGRVKVADFGVARLLGGGENVAATVVGTPCYMAPEQARGRGTSPATDVYSIGVVLYEMLAGCPPFSGTSAVELALCHLQDPPPPLPSTTPPALRAVVERALAKDPNQRYRDGSEMAEAFAPIQRSSLTSPVLPEPPRAAGADSQSRGKGSAGTLIAPWTSPRRDVRWARTRVTLAAYALVLVLLLVMIGGAILIGGARQVRVPDLKGLTRAEISASLRRTHLHMGFRTRYSSARRDTAIEQSPKAGVRVAEGSRVLALLSAGAPPVAVPRIVGFSSGDALSSLRQLGLRASIHEVPAPGASPGTVTGQTPSPGLKLRPGSSVSLSVAEAPRWRALITFTDRGGQTSPPFRIRGTRWRIVYRMSYNGTCTFIFFCMGPTAHVANLDSGTSVSVFDLNAGSDQIRTFDSGPGVYQVKLTPGDDSTRWSAQVEDYY